jgi:hypothetical protein
MNDARCPVPHSNETFVPGAELVISIYLGPGLFLASETGRGNFHNQSISGPGEPQCANACGFFNRKLWVADLCHPKVGLLSPPLSERNR